MSPYRVIVVDDEILLRQGLSARLSGSHDLKVVGVCSNGQAVLERLAAGSVEAIVLDLDMSCCEPVALLREIREKHPEVVVLSIAPSESFLRSIPASHILPGRSEAIVRPRQNTTAEAFLDDLAKLASKRLLEMLRTAERTRPGSHGVQIAPESRSAINSENSDPRRSAVTIAPESRSSIRTSSKPVEETASKVIERSDPAGSSTSPRSAHEPAQTRATRRVEVLAIASSTGGPQALSDLLSVIPRDFPIPVLIVQHMPAEFTKNLADRLNASCPLKIREASAGELLTVGTVLIAPGDFHMTVKKSDRRQVRVELNQDPMENSCRPAADVLFRGVAEVYGPTALGVVLTGMGKDGLAGTKVVRDAGGRVIVQDEASSVVWGMPGEIARAGLADAVLPLRELSAEILRRVSVGRI